MIKISRDPEKVPEWLKCTKTMIPDFVAEDPKVCMKKTFYLKFKYYINLGKIF